MANFRSTITVMGTETLTRFMALGQELLLTRAAAGNGITKEEQNKITGLVNPISVDISIGDKSFVESSPSYMLIPVYVSNKDLTEDVYIREVVIYGLDEDGAEFPFAYSWLDGADTDNILPATKMENGESDTAHIHDVVILATDQENAVVRVEVSGGNWVTAAQMEAYALRKPKLDGTAGQYLRRTADGSEWADLLIPPSFDNLLAWAGCRRVTPQKSGNTWTERIVTKEGGTLRAQRVTVITSEADVTETYTFYAEDGATVKSKYVVRTTKDETETWIEDVTQEG